MTLDSANRQYLPMKIATDCVCCPEPVELEVEEAAIRRKSPRMMAPCWMMHLPPRMIFCDPRMVAFLDTLLPVKAVWMYSLGA